MVNIDPRLAGYRRINSRRSTSGIHDSLTIFQEYLPWRSALLTAERRQLGRRHLGGWTSRSRSEGRQLGFVESSDGGIP